eukprot:3809270-Lingulodinium_polyedra.AAC.1
MKRASVRFASRCGSGRSIQPNHCVAFCKRYTMMRSKQRLAMRTPAHSTRAPVFWRARGPREYAVSEPLRQRTVDLTAALRS